MRDRSVTYDYIDTGDGFSPFDTDDGGRTNNADEGSRSLSVSAAMTLAKFSLERISVSIIGEVSEFNNKPGYKAVYFTIKDESAALPCIMWMNRFAACNVDVRIGMLVEITGKFSLYAAKGRMNFDVSSISIAGEGDLRLKVANLAKKLQAEGLMDPARKKPLPQFPTRIGLVTSPRGAAVHDVLRTLRRRYPLAEVIVAGVPVEGATAASGMAEALKNVAASGVEAILLVRGGGSFEDLVPFNDESLCRTIAALDVPVVTGIGHEPDTSIADMVADVRASTPTAAAETVSPNGEELSVMLVQRGVSLSTSLSRRLIQSQAILDSIRSRPVFADPYALFGGDIQALDVLSARLRRSMPLLITRHEQELAQRAMRLHDLSPLAVLARGYSIARDVRGNVIKSVGQVSLDDRIEIQVDDGRMSANVTSIRKG